MSVKSLSNENLSKRVQDFLDYCQYFELWDNKKCETELFDFATEIAAEARDLALDEAAAKAYGSYSNASARSEILKLKSTIG
jgi:hypothetical protein